MIEFKSVLSIQKTYQCLWFDSKYIRILSFLMTRLPHFYKLLFDLYVCFDDLHTSQ